MFQKLTINFVLAVVLMALPLLALAVNDVVIDGLVTFEFLTTDTSVLTQVTANAGGQATAIDVQHSYMDITLDNGSSITLNTTGADRYFTISKVSGSNDYVINPSCYNTSATLTGAGAQAVLRVAVKTTANDCGGGGGGGGGGGLTYPSSYSVTINSGTAATTASREVIINMVAQNADLYLISENPDFIGESWQDFINPMDVPWTLSEGDVIRTH